MNASAIAKGSGESSAERASGEVRKLSYRLITGPDDAEFCRRVSDALDNGYVLYGSPAITSNGQHAVAAQAVVLPEEARR